MFYERPLVGLLLTVISLFGLVGNIVAIVVLSRPTMKGSFSSLLIGEPFYSMSQLFSQFQSCLRFIFLTKQQLLILLQA